MRKTKRTAVYKVKYGRNAWKVFTWFPTMAMFTEGMSTLSYTTACDVVRTYRKAWDTRRQEFVY